jgi:hypothetical protein
MSTLCSAQLFGKSCVQLQLLHTQQSKFALADTIVVPSKTKLSVRGAVEISAMMLVHDIDVLDSAMSLRCSGMLGVGCPKAGEELPAACVSRLGVYN